MSSSHILAQTAPSASLGTLDLILFFVAVIGVIGFGIWQGNKGNNGGWNGGTAGYFLAGRGLTWWLVGFSLIAANISTEQFVGMSGQAADWLGMAIASYEWMAAITLVVVAFVFLPKLLRCGIYTIPEFLEYRYGVFAATVMAASTLGEYAKYENITNQKKSARIRY
jgi:solute:Na+ symporter, SSS family